MESYDFLKTRGLHAFKPFWLEQLAIDTKGSTGNTGAHKYINLLSILMADFLVNKGLSILLIDVDLVFFKDPTIDLLQSGEYTFDVAMMPAHTMSSKGPGNSGFVVVVSNDLTKTLLTSIANCALLNLWTGSDQMIWNEMLNEKWFHPIVSQVLSRERYPSHWDQSNPADTNLAHPISNNKWQKLKEFNLMFYDKTCSYWSEKVIVKEQL